MRFYLFTFVGVDDDDGDDGDVGLIFISKVLSKSKLFLTTLPFKWLKHSVYI